MTTLHDRLAELVEEAPDALPAPGLWDRGLRYGRRRRAGTAVVLAATVAALAVLGSVTWLRSPQAVEPLPATSPAGLPDQLYAPSPWLPGTNDAGPLGTIAALIPADRGTWTGIEDGQVVGVSAITGEYRFVDLPELAAHASSLRAWALSPDGAHVAYLYRASGSDVADSAATGLAIYDAKTGETRRHPLSGPRGIRAGDLAWAGDGTVVLAYGTISEEDDGLSRSQAPLAWTLSDDAPHTLEALPNTHDLEGSGPGFIVVWGDTSDRVVDVETGATLRSIQALPERMSEATFDNTGARVAMVVGNRMPNKMSVGVLGVGDAPHVFTEVPNSRRSFAAYAWIDDNHLALLQRKDARRHTVDVVVNQVDVRTGEASRLIALDALDVGLDRQFATDLLAEPTVRGVAPSHPLDPRKVTGAGTAIVLTAGAALILWRRRVRP